MFELFLKVDAVHWGQRGVVSAVNQQYQLSMQQRLFLQYVSIILVLIGISLLITPRHWMPDFYKPVFMGIIALTSPILIYLPKLILKKSTSRKRALILEMRTVIAFSLAVNIAGELGLFQLNRYGFEYDKLAHFTVSMLFAFILSESVKEWEHFTTRKVLLIVFLIVFSSGILWEIFEASSDFLFKTQEWGSYGKNVTWDTLGDIIFNTLGILAGIVVSKIPRRQCK